MAHLNQLYMTQCQLLSRVRLFVIPWTVAHQAPPSVEFSRQKYWRSGLPFPFPGDLPNAGIEPRSPTLQAGALLSEPPGKPMICDLSGQKSILVFLKQDRNYKHKAEKKEGRKDSMGPCCSVVFLQAKQSWSM